MHVYIYMYICKYVYIYIGLTPNTRWPHGFLALGRIPGPYHSASRTALGGAAQTDAGWCPGGDDVVAEQARQRGKDWAATRLGQRGGAYRIWKNEKDDVEDEEWYAYNRYRYCYCYFGILF